MTLTQLAGQAGLSQSFLSMVERGQRALDRRSHIAALASALRVSETDIVGGPHLTADHAQSDPHTYIPALRVALGTNTLTEPVVDRARPLASLVDEVGTSLEPLRRRCDYIAIGQRLPALIDELHYHAAASTSEEQYVLALHTLIEACVCACFTAKNLGHGDLAHVAALRAAEAASVLDDPVAVGKAAYLRVQTIPKTGSWQRALIAGERAVAALEPHASTALGAQVLGMLVLTTSLAAASLRDADEAHRWLNVAADIARHVPDQPHSNWQSFSATNVNVWRVTVAVENGQSGRPVLKLAEEVDQSKLIAQPSRRASFLADVGRGLARDSKTRDIAMTWLLHAEKVAPQRIRNNPQVREAVAVMMQRARAAAGGRELRGLAARMGIPH